MENTKDKIRNNVDKKTSAEENDKKIKKETTRTRKKNISKETSSSKSDKKSLGATSKSTSKKPKPKKDTLTSPSESQVISYPPSEYYDLPYRYNQTTVKILAQTPHALFIYWDISDSDRKEMLEKYGEKFFYETKPVLLVHNHTLNSYFEIEIDDFTNSWYLRTPTSGCVFTIELARKKIDNNNKIQFENNSSYMSIAQSNTIESPNDHILKNSLNTVYFKNIKTNQVEKRDVSNYSSIKYIYNIMELDNDDIGYENNPSSGF